MQPDGRWRITQAGAKLSYLWNHSVTGCADIGHNIRAHACEWCRSTKHRSVAYPQKPAEWTP